MKFPRRADSHLRVSPSDDATRITNCSSGCVVTRDPARYRVSDEKAPFPLKLRDYRFSHSSLSHVNKNNNEKLKKTIPNKNNNNRSRIAMTPSIRWRRSADKLLRKNVEAAQCSRAESECDATRFNPPVE